MQQQQQRFWVSRLHRRPILPATALAFATHTRMRRRAAVVPIHAGVASANLGYALVLASAAGSADKKSLNSNLGLHGSTQEANSKMDCVLVTLPLCHVWSACHLQVTEWVHQSWRYRRISCLVAPATPHFRLVIAVAAHGHICASF